MSVAKSEEMKSSPPPVSVAFMNLSILSPAERVRYAMAAGLILLQHTPKGYDFKTKPLVLDGGSRVEVGYLWTALVLLGTRHPIHKFNASGIRIDSYHFNPRTELAAWFSFATFSKKSIYETEFKQHLSNALFNESTFPQTFNTLSEEAYSAVENKPEFVIKELNAKIKKLEAAANAPGFFAPLSNEGLEEWAKAEQALKDLDDKYIRDCARIRAK